MAKKSLILALLLLFLAGFVVGYVTMSFDIKNGALGKKDNRNIWEVLKPF